jgi:hypothetical protein
MVGFLQELVVYKKVDLIPHAYRVLGTYAITLPT